MERKKRAKSLEKHVPVSGEIEAETPAALQTDVVLQNIFKYLGYKDLKSCRRIKNIKWLENSKIAWWSQAKVLLKEDKIEDYFNQTDISSCAKNLEFRYFLTGDYYSIWENFGHSIKFLEFRFCKFKSVDEFRQIIYTKCPNLESLVTSLIDTSTYTVAVEPMEWQEPQFGVHKSLKFLKMQANLYEFPLSWMELLSHFPNLEALEVYTSVDIYRVISIIRQHDPKKLKLKRIDISGIRKCLYGDSLRLVLLDPNLSFETIRIGHGVCDPKSLEDILDLHAKSLKELCFVESVYDPVKISPRQLLLNLENLSLSGCQFAADFLKWTPNLRKIHLDYDGAQLMSDELNLRIDTCKELAVSSQGQWRDSDLRFFLNAFSNVEILEINGLNNQQFSMICEHWTKLVSFTVASNSLVDDFGLLGFNPDSETETTRNPNISNFNDLQIFSMSSKSVGVNQNETEGAMVEMKNSHAVLNELKKLKTLKTFELKNYQLKGDEWMQIFARYPDDQ